MDLNEIRDFLGEDWKRVEKIMKEMLESDIELLDRINGAILSHAGKMIRPLIAMLIARACSGGCPTEASYKYAASAELLHNATLLHDDVADNSNQRRGNPTIKSLLGPTVSVLVGDFWLVKAMESILSASDDARVIRIFANTLSDLAEGEMLQLEKADKVDTQESDYYRIVFNKTASLFRAAALTAAISVNCSDNVQDAMGKYAEFLGIAFQIRDDIFDYSPSVSVGKPVGVDVAERKITLPLLGALSGATREKDEEIRSLVSDIDNHPEYKDVILDFVRKGGGIEYSEKRLSEYIEQAVKCLDILPDSMEKNYLGQLAYFVGQRVS